MKNITLSITTFLVVSICWSQTPRQSASSSVKKEYKEILNRTDSHKKIESSFETIAYPIKEYEAMVNRCEKLTERLRTHNRLALMGKMNTEKLEMWKRDVVQAKLLRFQISDFLEKYTDGGELVQRLVKKNTLGNFDDFSKELNDAGKYVGL